MNYETKRKLKYVLFIIIGVSLTIWISSLLSRSLGLNEFAIAVIFYLPLSFMITYFHYPKMLRKNPFSNQVFYRDSGLAFLILILIHLVTIILRSNLWF